MGRTRGTLGDGSASTRARNSRASDSASRVSDVRASLDSDGRIQTNLFFGSPESSDLTTGHTGGGGAGEFDGEAAVDDEGFARDEAGEVGDEE